MHGRIACSARRRGSRALAAVLTISAASPSIVAAAAEPPCLEVVSRRVLPPSLEWALDVRWSAPGRAFLSASPEGGVFELDLSAEAAKPELRVAQGDALDEIFIPWALGLSPRYLAVASAVYMIGWKDLAAGRRTGLDGVDSFASVIDVDLLDDELLVLGVRRDDRGRFAHDGNILWSARLSSGRPDFVPIMASAQGPGVPGMDDCGPMRLGSVVYRPDGSFVVIPGSEEGVYLFGPDRTVARSWLSADIGFDAGCPIPEEERQRYWGNQRARDAWVNQRRTIDEVLALGDSIGLLVREARGGRTQWRLARLRVHGGVLSSCRLPFDVASDLAHLRGQAIGDELLLLLAYEGYTQDTPHPPAAPELIRLRYRP